MFCGLASKRKSSVFRVEGLESHNVLDELCVFVREFETRDVLLYIGETTAC